MAIIVDSEVTVVVGDGDERLAKFRDVGGNFWSEEHLLVKHGSIDSPISQGETHLDSSGWREVFPCVFRAWYITCAW